MEPALFSRLRTCGTDIDTALDRCMGNAALYETFLRRFPEEPCMNELRLAIKEQNREKAIRASHTLKGLSGNLGMDPLYQASSRANALLNHAKPEEAYAMLPEIETAYLRILDAILAPDPEA